jgi:predicted DCC family thiol-disulfide oxidoreductase YuxK
VIILFDGVCNLCSGSVQFIIKRDRKRLFKFASLQSELAHQRLQQLGILTHSFQSIILLKDDRVLQQSDAALEIAKNLNGLWPLFYSFKILPQFIRDGIYAWIAKNRYRWFGKKDSCWIPSPDLKSRFID